ncbi:Cox11p ASCRUDRAFT_25715, partial [Ascoidea rubescens DSM 1968]
TQYELYEMYQKARREKEQFNNRSAGYYAASLGIVFLGFAFCSVPLYRILCSRVGWGGTPMTDKSKFTADKLIPVDLEKRIKISFTSTVSSVLPWKFVPQQKEVYVLPGETALAFFKAKNYGDKDVIGMATYSITPGEASIYFNKIQCFCFEEQKLKAGEEVDMPVFFFIDPDFAEDPQMRNIDDIILNYSFFKAQYSNK